MFSRWYYSCKNYFKVDFNNEDIIDFQLEYILNNNCYFKQMHTFYNFYFNIYKSCFCLVVEKSLNQNLLTFFYYLIPVLC